MAWNRASEAPKVAPKKSPSAMRGIVAGLVVVVLGVIALVMFSGGEADSRPLQKEDRGLIKEVTPAAAPKAAVEEKKRLTNREIQMLSSDETNRLNQAEIEYWKMFHPWPPPDKDQPKPVFQKSKIFASAVDNEIALLLTIKPGTTIIGRSTDFSEGFERRFLRSLKRPIEVVGNEQIDKDSDYAKELKKAVVDAKADLKAAYDRGEDLEKIYVDSRDELQRLGAYKMELQQLVAKEVRSAERKGFSDQEVDDIIGAANKMLESKGIAPIEHNSITRRAIQFQTNGGSIQ